MQVEIATSRVLVGRHGGGGVHAGRSHISGRAVVDCSLTQVPESYRFPLPLSVRLVNTILTKTSGDT
jgi:hypothetical protein